MHRDRTRFRPRGRGLFVPRKVQGVGKVGSLRAPRLETSRPVDPPRFNHSTPVPATTGGPPRGAPSPPFAPSERSPREPRSDRAFLADKIDLSHARRHHARARAPHARQEARARRPHLARGLRPPLRRVERRGRHRVRHGPRLHHTQQRRDDHHRHNQEPVLRRRQGDENAMLPGGLRRGAG